MQRRKIIQSLLLAAAPLLPLGARAQRGKPITVLVPFAPGGGVDVVARQLSHNLGNQLGQPVLIDNRAGAGGTIASAMLAHAAPDGQTIMFHHMGAVFNAALYEKLPFDTRKDLVPVAHIGATPTVLVVTDKLPVKTVQEFIAYARANPGKINYGSGGVGSAGHLAMETLQSAAGLRLTHIPYKGSGPATSDLISGQIQVMLMVIAAVKPLIDAGKVRAIATSGLTRTAALPKLPTLDESGIKGFDYAPWYGVFAPPGTPVPVLDRLNEVINQSLKDPENQKRLADQGLEVQAMTRQKFSSMFYADIEKWGKTIHRLNIKAE